MLSRHLLTFTKLFVLGWLFLNFPLAGGLLQPVTFSKCEVVVLSDPDDPFWALAQELAAAENALLAHSLEEAVACQPEFLLWVISPTFLSDATMIEFGQLMKAQPTAISTGLITGTTIEQARALWKRSAQVRGDLFFAVNAPNPAAHIDAGRIMQVKQGEVVTQPLTKAGFTKILQSADYVTFTGHGANQHLKLDEDTLFTSVDVPFLDSVIVETGSCQTVRLWNDNSIALKFIDQGAAGYSGFVFSPNEGYLIGEFNGLPFRYTWADFPIGHVIQVQNQGTLQGFAAFPYQFLVGDPRIALQSEPPYEMVEDRQEGMERKITYRAVPEGVVPIRVENGAAYPFIEISGNTSASEQDPFYNSRLQMVNIGDDKFILLLHQGGDLTLRMRMKTPWYWLLGDILSDSLDDTFIFNPQAGGELIALAFVILPLAWIGWQALRKRLTWRVVLIAAAVGVGAALFQGVYSLIRLDQVTITSKAVAFSSLSLLAGFTLSFCGTLIYLQSQSIFGKIIALLVITFISWSPIVFGLVVIGVFNVVFFMPKTGVPLYNYSLGLLPVASFALTLILAGLVLWRTNVWNHRKNFPIS
jgi:hypothetical protein